MKTSRRNDSQFDSRWGCVGLQTEHDSYIFDEDTIEIFVDGNFDRSTYYQLAVSCAGTFYDGKGLDKSWDGPWQVQTSRGERSWFVEARIPFETFGIEAGPGTVCGIGVAREHQAGGRKYSCWSDLGRGFHTPDKFTQVVFDNFLVRLRKVVEEKARAFDARDREIIGLLAAHPNVAKRRGGPFAQMRQGVADIRQTLLVRESVETEEFLLLPELMDVYLKRHDDLNLKVKLAVLAEQ